MEEKEHPLEAESTRNDVRTDKSHTVRELSVSTDQEKRRVDTVPAFCGLNNDVKPVYTGKTLSGYLNKRRLGDKLNQYKKRWFVCHDSTCQLLYYKTHNDVSALGRIDISCSTLTTELECEREHVFKIW